VAVPLAEVRVMNACAQHEIDPTIAEEQARVSIVTFRARTRFRDQVVRPLLDEGILKMTIPGKPTGSKQRYRTTESGARVLSE